MRRKFKSTLFDRLEFTMTLSKARCAGQAPPFHKCVRNGASAQADAILRLPPITPLKLIMFTRERLRLILLCYRWGIAKREVCIQWGITVMNRKSYAVIPLRHKGKYRRQYRGNSESKRSPYEQEEIKINKSEGDDRGWTPSATSCCRGIGLVLYTNPDQSKLQYLCNLSKQKRTIT